MQWYGEQCVLVLYNPYQLYLQGFMKFSVTEKTEWEPYISQKLGVPRWSFTQSLALWGMCQTLIAITAY